MGAPRPGDPGGTLSDVEYARRVALAKKLRGQGMTAGQILPYVRGTNPQPEPTAKTTRPTKLPIGERRTPTPKGMAKGGVVVSQSDIDSLIREGVGEISLA